MRRLLAVAPQCDKACIEAQLKQGHKGMGDQRKAVKYSPTGKNDMSKFESLKATIAATLGKLGRRAR